MRLPTVILFFLAGSSLSAAELDDLCKRMVEWREAISTLECEFTYTKEAQAKKGVDPVTYKARWIESPSKIYRRIDRAGSVDEYVWEDGIEKALFDSRSNKASESGSVGATSKDAVYMAIGSPWVEVSLSRIGRPSPPFPTFFRSLQPQLAVAKTTYDGRACSRVTYTHPVSHAPYEWVVDPERGLVLASSVAFTADRQNRVERKVDSVAEVAPGVFFPGRVVQRQFKRGALAETSTIVFTKVNVNAPIDSDPLRVSFPPNLPVIDSSKRIVYRTDDQERPIPSSIEPIRMSRDQLDAIEAARPWYHRWTHWLGIGGVLVILASGLAYVRQRRRLRNVAD
jgi:hypothetical protein